MNTTVYISLPSSISENHVVQELERGTYTDRNAIANSTEMATCTTMLLGLIRYFGSLCLLIGVIFTLQRYAINKYEPQFVTNFLTFVTKNLISSQFYQNFVTNRLFSSQKSEFRHKTPWFDHKNSSSGSAKVSLRQFY